MPRRSQDIGEPHWSEALKRWRLDIRVDGKRKSFYSSLKSPLKAKAECRRKARNWLDLGDRSQVRVAEAWELFIAAYGEKNKETSTKQIDGRGRAHIIPALGTFKLVEVSKPDWQDIVYDAYEGGAKSVATLRGVAATIRTFCKWCAAKGYIGDHDVPLYFDMPTNKKTRVKTILQPDELIVLFSDDEAESDWYMPMWRFLALMGLRRGELCALQEERDFDGEFITINESISHDRIVTDGKTVAAERTLALSPLALAELERHRAMRKKLGLGETKYLFTNQDGERIAPRVLRNHWQKWREVHGIDITLHELRHTYISYSVLETDISLEELKLLYGHTKNMDTQKVYVHAIEKSPSEMRAEREKARHNARVIDGVFENLISGNKGGKKREKA